MSARTQRFMSLSVCYKTHLLLALTSGVVTWNLQRERNQLSRVGPHPTCDMLH